MSLAARRPGHRWNHLARSALGAVEAWGLVQALRMRRLRRDYLRLLELEASKSAFLYLAAHELRTPVALVRGYLEMIGGQTLGPVSPEAKEALRRADAKLAEMNELVSQMVEMARLQEGHQLHLELVDVRDVVREAIDRTEPLARSDHNLVADDPGRPVRVMADRFRIRTILTNLIGNAIKYSPQGGEIRVSIKNSGGSVDVSVSDQGIGIKPAELDQLFQPFARKRPQRVGPGLGLGLYVAREIARAHKGDLSVSSNADQGSTFVVTLPAAR